MAKKNKQNRNNKREALTKEPIGLVSNVIAWCSFIPFLGVFCALIAIMLGLSSEKEGANRVVKIGLIGFLYSLVVYGIFIYLALQREAVIIS